jgi:hypothetical protein
MYSWRENTLTHLGAAIDLRFLDQSFKKLKIDFLNHLKKLNRAY